MANLIKDDSKVGSSFSDKGQIGQAMEKASRNIGRDIGSVFGKVSDRASSYIKTTRSYVEEKPLQSVAIAAATGVAVGSILTMATRRRK